MDKEQQLKLLIEIMEADEKDGLYDYHEKIILQGLREEKEKLQKEIQQLKTNLEKKP